VLAQWDRLAFQLARQAAKIAEDVGRQSCLAACLGSERIAGFECDQTRQLLGLSLHLVGDA
jgi:hypothetical protein